MSLPRTMRVGYVLKRYPRYSETFIVNEILAHEAAGLQVEIFSLRPPEEIVLHDINDRVRAPIHYLPHGVLKVSDWWRALRVAGSLLSGSKPLLEADDEQVSLSDLYQALVLAGEARRGGLHHLHAHFASSATTVARLAGSVAGLPYTFTAHANDIFNQNVQPEHLRRKLEEAAAVVTVSDYNIAYLRETFGAAAARVRRIYNGLDLDRFRYAPPTDCPPRIVSVGRLVEKKGFDVLIDACAILARRGTRFTCRIIGDGELEAGLRARVEQLGLGAQVELDGARPQAEVMEQVRGAAVLAAPCVVGKDGNRDGLPTVLLEAMALGTPCVSTDVTGIPEVVRDGETGLMVPQRDAGALADALQQLLADAALRVRLASRARALIETEFDIRANAADLRGVFWAATSAAMAAQREAA